MANGQTFKVGDTVTAASTGNLAHHTMYVAPTYLEILRGVERPRPLPAFWGTVESVSDAKAFLGWPRVKWDGRNESVLVHPDNVSVVCAAAV